MSFFRRLRTVGGGILPKLELFQDFMVVLITCKNEEDLNKNEGSRVLTRFSLLYMQVYGNFSKRSRADYSVVESG